MDQRIKELIARLTLEEKAALTSGEDNWFTKSVKDLEIIPIRMSDGPHGLRTQEGNANNLNEHASVKAVCFPAGCTSAASFDCNLLEELSEVLGREAQSLGVHVLLGPGINIKRSPLCGRNFEYFSEDPIVAGKLGASYVNGVQKEGVGTSLKHFFANNQEYRRMDASSNMDERTMREIYLTAFEMVIKNAQPWTIMAAYNKIDGVYATENKKYLTELLREEWGYKGCVISDWGAVHDRSAAIEAGCALTMPSATTTDFEIVEAVKAGKLDEEDLNFACEQILTLMFKAQDSKKEEVNFNYEKDHKIAKKIAEESAVLLKNEEAILPLSKEDEVVFIGDFARKPRYQGGGSSHINSFKVVSALEAAEKEGYQVAFAQGYPVEGVKEEGKLLDQAVLVAKKAKVAVVFVGLPDVMESEGVDRRHMKMPESHNTLIEEVCKVNPNTVVVLHHGSPVEMPWKHRPKAILEMYLGGQAVGEATVNILYGQVNPSGHLPETFPEHLQDNPSYLSYFGEGDKIDYMERFFVGYRYYTTKEIPVAFPFGTGLSYTSFEYKDLTLDKSEMDDIEILKVKVTVKNTGERVGKALVQLYVAPPREEVIRPVRELKAFEKIELHPKEEKEVSFILEKRAFAHWSMDMSDWRIEPGEYGIQICENAEKVLLEQTVKVYSDLPYRKIVYSLDMSMGDFAKTIAGREALDSYIGYMVKGMAAIGYLPENALQVIEAMGGGTINLETVEMLAEHMGTTETGATGLLSLFAQQVSMLAKFLPQEKRMELQVLIDELNKELSD
ncbi:MAG TPA: glycoside hydrolase family 3 C-terminal domain-containing protein [Candidatus Merdenecus merdavium]|nr:glycoside hydrolase family 3 C-terminal domain-containing protein [Candidatus Merdenecus merdavium]